MHAMIVRLSPVASAYGNVSKMTLNTALLNRRAVKINYILEQDMDCSHSTI